MGNKEGEQFDLGGGERLTVNPTDNPNYPGGWYQTTTDADGNKSTAVYDKDGNMPSGKGTGDNGSYR
ncbi:hypothetical protein [Arthrobacter sp. 35W]|uniref:hypothetical protein n=1 Tax=Arthrobacter sp. 35W TaxID=1132441 RepID=UPI000408C025|nr:hypothetical protein [Arthrobacter sp. 35W]